MADEHDTPEEVILFPEPPAADPKAAPSADEMQRNLFALHTKLTQEIAFRERMCAEAVSAVLEKYGCVVSISNGAVQIVNRK